AARGEALGFHHEAVAGAGDDQGFAAGERVQTDADDLFGGFGGAEGVVRLGGYLLEFGGGGAGAERSDVYAMRAHLLGERFGERQVERLCRRVGADIRDGLEGGRGGEDEDVAAAAGDHAGEVEMGEVHDRGDIHLEHFELAAERNFVEPAVGAEAGVVHQDFHGD